jgi:hypothetical protein
LLAHFVRDTVHLFDRRPGPHQFRIRVDERERGRLYGLIAPVGVACLLEIEVRDLVLGPDALVVDVGRLHVPDRIRAARFGAAAEFLVLHRLALEGDFRAAGFAVEVRRVLDGVPREQVGDLGAGLHAIRKGHGVPFSSVCRLVRPSGRVAANRASPEFRAKA